MRRPLEGVLRTHPDLTAAVPGLTPCSISTNSGYYVWLKPRHPEIVIQRDRVTLGTPPMANDTRREQANEFHKMSERHMRQLKCAESQLPLQLRIVYRDTRREGNSAPAREPHVGPVKANIE